MSQFIPLSVPNLKGNEQKYVSKAIGEEWVSTAGSFVDDFEVSVARYTGAEGAVACQSGTAGLHLALLACGVGPGDEVLVPALTFIAAVNPVKYAGAEPIFMDCDDTLCMDMDKVKDFIETSCTFDGEKLVANLTGAHVKAMLVVHVFGNMADMAKALDLARKYRLKLIEDATEALGTYCSSGELAGRFAGSIGDVGVFSFNGNKIITTGGGGMIVSDNPAILAECKYLSTQAKDDQVYFIHNKIGYNYRMTNVQAAIGLAQLEQLEAFIETKGANYRHYIDRGVDLLPFRSDVRPNYWFYSFITDNRDDLIRDLGARGIQARPVWHLICDLPMYRNAVRHRIEKATWYHEHIVNIPCSSNLSADDVERVAGEIMELEKCYE